jgi:molybdate transport system substrate-binding protein
MRLAALVLVLGLACNGDKHISVGAAASLRSAMPELAAAFEKQTGMHVDVRFGSSDVLAKQVRDGAVLDALIVADETVLDPALFSSHKTIATNPIVLVGPAGTDTDFSRLASLPGSAKIAIGDPASVPVGRYARQYLQQIGSWDALQARLAKGGDAAGVLALAQSGSALVAIVYKSDASAGVPLVILDAPTNAPVAHISIDVVTRSRHADAAGDFAKFLTSPAAQQILAHHDLGPATTTAPGAKLD